MLTTVLRATPFWRPTRGRSPAATPKTRWCPSLAGRFLNAWDNAGIELTLSNYYSARKANTYAWMGGQKADPLRPKGEPYDRL